MGMHAGVSDLIYHNHGFMGLEVKVRGEKHKADHIKSQLRWGKSRVEAGGNWCIITSVEGFWHVLKVQNFEHVDVFSIEDVQAMLDTGRKTIVF
jgi:hypothetical protein